MRKILLYAIAAALFAACSVDTSEDMTILAPDVPEELYVSFDEEDTRIQLKNGRPVWTAGDLVSVFYRSNANDKWQFQGKTGDLDGTLKRLEQGVPTIAASKVIAVYPYSTNYMYVPALELVEASLPGTQNYTKDSFGVGSSIMIASDNYRQLNFKNVCGWIKFQFTGNQTIKTISFRGNSGEQVAGDICIYTEDASCVLASEMGAIGDNGVGGSLDFEDSVLTSVTLDCGEGVTLNKSTATAFYIALPPQTFKNGFTVNLTCVDGTQKEISTEKNTVIERNHILPIAAMEVAMEVPNGSATFAANTITWNYLDDAAEDAKIYDNDKNTTASYSREITLATPVNNLPGNMTVEELLAKSGDLVSTKINGVASDAVSISGNETDGYVLHFSNFEWDKTYEIEFAYENIKENNGIMYSATLSTTIKTIGRTNETITLTSETTVNDHENLSFSPFTEGVAPIVSLTEAYSKITYQLGFDDSHSFFAEVLSNIEGKEYSIIDTIESYDVAGVLDNNILFDNQNESIWAINEEYQVSVGYSCSMFKQLPNKVVYTRKIKLWYGQEIQIAMTVNIKYLNLDFKYNSTYVAIENNALKSTIKASYTPNTNTSALQDYKVELNLCEAFSVINKEDGKVISYEDLAAAGYIVEFKIMNKFDSNGNPLTEDELINAGLVGIDIEDNVLKYYGYAEEVNVRGYIQKLNNESGNNIKTQFDTSSLYANYTVSTKGGPLGLMYRYCEEGTTTPKAFVENIPNEPGVYKYNLLEYITIKDSRNTGKNYSLIDSNNSFVLGDDTNGFASGVNVVDLYHISGSAVFEPVKSIHKKYIECFSIEYNKEDRKLYLVIDTTNVAISGSCDIDIKLTLSTPWNSSSNNIVATIF